MNKNQTIKTPVASIEATPVKSISIRKRWPRFLSAQSFKIYNGKGKECEYLSQKTPKTLRLSKSPIQLKEKDKLKTVPELLEKSLKAEKKQQYDKSLSLIDKALSLNPKNAEAWNRKGYVCHLCDKLCQAVECYEISLQYNPKNAIVWNNKGGVYLGLEKLQDALLCFNEAVLIDPNYKVGWNNQGVTFRKMGKIREALTSHEKAFLLDNNDPLTLIQLGRISFLLADLSAAESYFDKAIKIDPKNYQALYGKGVLLREMRDHENALKYFNKAMSINPTYQEDHWISPFRTPANIPSPPSNTFSDSESLFLLRSELSKSDIGLDAQIM